MSLLTPEMPLSNALESYTTLIPLISRFGIRLGNADRSINQVCAEHEIDPIFMLTLMNTFLFEEYFPEQRLKSFLANQIVDYLTKTNAYYLHYQLPNIERHLMSLVSSGEGENKHLALLGKFFEDFKALMTSRIENDMKVWFPYCLKLSAGGDTAGCAEMIGRNSDDQDATLVGMLRDMRSIMVRHLSGRYNDNLAYAVIFAVTSLERDIRQHSRIRERILNPLITRLCPECDL